MNSEQAQQLVALLRENWDSPPWTQERWDLFVHALLPYPYSLAAPIVGDVIRKGGKSYRVVVSDITVPLDAAVQHQRQIATTRAEQRLLAAPPDPKVREILRNAVQRLEAKARKAFGPSRRSFDPSAPASKMTEQEIAARKRLLRRQAERFG